MTPLTLTVKGKQSFVLVSTAAIACGGLDWQGFTDKLVHSFSESLASVAESLTFGSGLCCLDHAGNGPPAQVSSSV